MLLNQQAQIRTLEVKQIMVEYNYKSVEAI